MRTIIMSLSTVLLVVLSSPLFSQDIDLQQLETEMRAASGSQRAQKLLELTDAYLQAGNYEKAVEFAEEAGAFAKKIGQSEMQAIALNREGKIAQMTGKKGLFGKDRAAGKFRQSLDLVRSQRRPNKELALDNLQQLRAIASKAGRSGEVADIDAQIARVNDVTEVLPTSSTILSDKPLTKQELRQELSVITDQLIKQQKVRDVNDVQRLSYEKERAALQAELAEREAEIDKMTEDQMKAALLLMQHRNKLDSLEYRTNLDSLNMANAQLALSDSESKRNFYFAGLIGMLLLAGGSLFSFIRARQNAKMLSEKNKIIRAEQERSENLLLNILPALVADELKKQGRTSARYFEDVSVLFADFVGFSKIAEKLTPQQLVTELDTCFQAFDQIITKYNLEKIKTIGDAYMAAGGLPNGGGSQLRDMIQAARDMQEWLASWNTQRRQNGLPVFEARIGIHRGPVVAGVVGSRKFAFDIWGDTVNIAARIEAAGEGGKINISGEVYKMIGEFFPCHYRGKIPAKNKGDIDMYFVEN